VKGLDRPRRGRWTGRIGGLAAPVLIAVLLAALAPPAPAADGVYRRPIGNDPSTLDPARINDSYGRTIAQQIFDGLVEFDQTLTITPALAQFWKSSRDGLTWTFMLRRGVRFHHGREMTSDDVVYSLSRLLDPNVKSSVPDLFGSVKGAEAFREGRLGQVSGITALDRYTVQITLTESLAPFVSVLAVGHAKIVPRDLVEQLGEAFGQRPVGTGPFRFVGWERGKEIVLAANPDYFDGPPRLGQIVYRVFSGEQVDAMYADFQKGLLEDTRIPIGKYRADTSGSPYLYVRRPTFSLRFYGLNTRWKPLTDRRVRQALVYAIDREGVIRDIFQGRYIPARGILPPGTLGYNPKLPGYPHDPARARELLAQSGFPEGRGLPPLVIYSSVRSAGILREHEEIKRALAAVGVQAEFHYLPDWTLFSRALAEGRAPAFLYAWNADVPDPDNFLFRLFHSRSPRNLTGYANPVVDDLLAQARREADVQRRVDLYRRAEQLVLTDAPVIPVWHYAYEGLFQPYVRSVEVNGLGDPYIRMRKIWLDGPR
jgi:oligopeptide transport system substrate-binding protein